MEQSDRVGGETVRKSFFVLVFLACFSGYVSVVRLPWFTLFFCLAVVINTFDSQLSTGTKNFVQARKARPYGHAVSYWRRNLRDYAAARGVASLGARYFA